MNAGPGFRAAQIGLHTPTLTTLPLGNLSEHFLPQTIALAFIYCALVATSGLCPRPDSDEIRLMTSPGHQRRQTNSGAPISLWATHFPTAVFLMMAHVLKRPSVFLDGVKTTSSVFPLCFLTFLI